MQKINHQNVIRLKDVNWDCTYEKKNGTKIQVILVVLELATGGELFDFLAFTGPFEETIARAYFHQLIAGIAHCHSAGYAHRDIKPEVWKEETYLSVGRELKVFPFLLTSPLLGSSLFGSEYFTRQSIRIEVG